VNESGGINGRKIEMVVRDSKGAPQEAAKVTRDLINNDGCQIIIDAEASSGAFAVQEVIREIGVLCMHTNSETSSLTADPKLHVPTAFRTARQGIHDAIGGGDYAAKIAKAKGLKKWATCSPDYAYGRSNTAEFMEYAKHFDGSIQVVEESWPKLFQPDYTEVVTKLLNAKADAMYSALWGGDLVAFIDQANLYGLFDKQASFMVNLGDYGVVDQVKQFPQGVYSGGRYNRTVPPTKENEEWYQNYVKTQKHKPTNWSWENDVAAQMVVEALKNPQRRHRRLLATENGLRRLQEQIDPLPLEAEIVRHLRHGAPEPGHQLGGSGRAEIRLADILPLGNDQHMNRRQRVDVVKGQRELVLVDLLARQLAAQNPGEDVVAVVGGHDELQSKSLTAMSLALLAPQEAPYTPARGQTLWMRLLAWLSSRNVSHASSRPMARSRVAT